MEKYYVKISRTEGGIFFCEKLLGRENTKMLRKNKLRVRNNELLLVFEPVIICAWGERMYVSYPRKDRKKTDKILGDVNLRQQDCGQE